MDVWHERMDDAGARNRNELRVRCGGRRVLRVIASRDEAGDVGSPQKRPSICQQLGNRGNGMKEGQASRKQLTIQKKQSAWREVEAPRALAMPLKL